MEHVKAQWGKRYNLDSVHSKYQMSFKSVQFPQTESSLLKRSPVT